MNLKTISKVFLLRHILTLTSFMFRSPFKCSHCHGYFEFEMLGGFAFLFLNLFITVLFFGSSGLFQAVMSFVFELHSLLFIFYIPSHIICISGSWNIVGGVEHLHPQGLPCGREMCYLAQYMHKRLIRVGCLQGWELRERTGKYRIFRVSAGIRKPWIG